MATPIKTVKRGSLQIEILHYKDGRYGFDVKPSNGERKRYRKRTLEAAEKQASRLIGEGQGGKIDLLSIDPAKFAKFLKWESEQTPDILVSDLVDQFLESKGSKGRSEWTMRDLERLKKFAEAFPVNLSELSRREVESWLDSREVSARTWNNLLDPIKAMHKFARKNGYLTAALTPVEQIEKKEAASIIETYSPEEMQGLLKVITPDWLPAVVLGAFAGIRPEEAAPDPTTSKPGLRWENILWHKRKIDVPKAVAKDRRRRFVPLADAVVAFLSDIKRDKGDIAPRKRMANQSRHWIRKSGVAWKKDGLRHSYASYRLAILNDIQALALEMGNSAKMIHDHYLDLKHEDEAEEWFAIRP